MIGEENTQPYSRHSLSKDLWMFKDQDDTDEDKIVNVFYPPLEQCDSLNDFKGQKLFKGVKVVGLNVEEKTVTLDNSAVIGYEKILIATGGSPSMYLIPNVIYSVDHRFLNC